MVFFVPRVAKFSGQVLDVLHHPDLVVKNFDGSRHVDYDLVLGRVVLRAVDGLNQTKHLAHGIDGAETEKKPKQFLADFLFFCAACLRPGGTTQKISTNSNPKKFSPETERERLLTRIFF